MADFVPPPKNSASPFADMRGHHVAVRAPSLAEAKDFYVTKLDFRVIAEWDYADEKLALSGAADGRPLSTLRCSATATRHPTRCARTRTSATA